ncbi:SDR family NAD(P)-dependent oxidoreductase [Gymnodinialimonas sp. 2305UL16-5]|uniref:SDR family NAD(P)-dependent oxidoreductase n=1 Tax=Gymnodinialimonas mytili TaxID=3126503 RepID=UPI0030B76FB7
MPNCLIVGVGPGLSQAIAQRFARGGYNLGMIARRADLIEQLSEKLQVQGAQTAWATADAGNEAELLDAIKSIEGMIGQTDVLIYNAAVMHAAGPLDLTSRALRREFEVNVVGAFAASGAVAPNMLRKGKGAILFTGGGLALEPYPEWTSLAAGKAALRSLAFSLFKEMSPKGVNVAVIAVCGIVKHGGLFDPARIAEEYWRLATAADGLADRELIFQPAGSDPHYNDPERVHVTTSITPEHARK